MRTITPTKTQLLSIPSGSTGTLVTLKWMKKFARNYKKSQKIRGLALSLVKSLGSKNFIGEARLIHRYVRDNIRYVRDIVGVETIQTPIKTLEIGQGDCDDKSVLAASLLLAIGHPVRFAAVGFNRENYSHVFPETKIGSKWIAVETTEPWPLGRTAPNVIKRMVINV